jgi:catechol 2,3-dioxygenase-like lactoylglutathione lyase family enzyme
VTLKQITLVTIQVRDFNRMVAWYTDVLGLEVGWLEPDEFCTLNAADRGASLALATDHPERIPDRPGMGWTPTLAVDNFDATINGLRDAGVTVDGVEEGSDEGYRLVRILDPEGNPIGLTTT